MSERFECYRRHVTPEPEQVVLGHQRANSLKPKQKDPGFHQEGSASLPECALPNHVRLTVNG